MFGEPQFLHFFRQDISNLLWLGLGLFIAGVLEAFLWNTSLFKLLDQPIQSDLFGENKRWRGLFSLPLTTVVAVIFFQLIEANLVQLPPNFVLFSNFNYLEYGLLVGFVFNLSELPNSFIKRRLKIPPGDESSKLFYFVDHMDSTYGVLLMWYLYFHFPGHLIITGLAIAPLLFMGATWLRKKLGLK